MMTYVLYMVLYSGSQSVAIEAHDYSSEAACIVAGEANVAKFSRRSLDVVYTCTGNGVVL